MIRELRKTQLKELKETKEVMLKLSLQHRSFPRSGGSTTPYLSKKDGTYEESDLKAMLSVLSG